MVDGCCVYIDILHLVFDTIDLLLGTFMRWCIIPRPPLLHLGCYYMYMYSMHVIVLDAFLIPQIDSHESPSIF
jgi:hypothetical protein